MQVGFVIILNLHHLARLHLGLLWLLVAALALGGLTTHFQIGIINARVAIPLRLFLLLLWIVLCILGRWSIHVDLLWRCGAQVGNSVVWMVAIGLKDRVMTDLTRLNAPIQAPGSPQQEDPDK